MLKAEELDMTPKERTRIAWCFSIGLAVETGPVTKTPVL